MIAIIDYGVGNLFSVSASLQHLNIPHQVTKDISVIQTATHILLPGVGAFGDASKQLFDSGLGEVVKEQARKKPLLGICVGMQLLFDTGYEFGEHSGLGLISGSVSAISDDFNENQRNSLKIPHMGWNSLKFEKKSPLFTSIKEGDAVYFVHSFHGKTEQEFISSTVEYGIEITATVERGHIYGCQFHPEKSGDVGLQILKSFYESKPQF